jgi:hypothetical protein
MQRAHHRDMRHHRIAATLANHHQHFGSCLPWRGLLFSLGQFYDVVRSVAQLDEGTPVWQNDRIEKLLIPRHGLGLVAAAVNLSVRAGQAVPSLPQVLC